VNALVGEATRVFFWERDWAGVLLMAEDPENQLEALRSEDEGSAFGAVFVGFVVFFLLSGGVMALGGGMFSPPPPTTQPIVFDHRKHVEENDLECATCHEFFETESFSGLPSAEICSFCHQEPQGESPEELKLVQLIEDGTPLDWKPLFRQPPHVFYSHRAHVAVARIECDTCHGTIGVSDAPPEHVEPLSMNECLACHRREGVAIDCTTCHR
jgi:hypothetical protein